MGSNIQPSTLNETQPVFATNVFPTKGHSLPFINQRLTYLMENDKYNDVTFVVGIEKKKFSAHKLILASGSPVFEAMFYGPAKSEEETVEIPDCDIKAFELMLQYIYGNIFRLKQINILDNVFEIIYIASKYQVADLLQVLQEKLKKQISVNNCLKFLQMGDLFCMDNLKQNCYLYLDQNASMILCGEEFLNLSREMIISILKRNTLVIKEVELIHSVMKWFMAECQRQNIECEVTRDNVRKVLKDAFYLIRFPTLNTSEFAEIINKYDIFDANELKHFFTYLVKRETQSINEIQNVAITSFNLSPRNSSKSLNCCQSLPVATLNISNLNLIASQNNIQSSHVDEYYTLSRISNNQLLVSSFGKYGHALHLTFKVSQPITIIGLGLHGATISGRPSLNFHIIPTKSPKFVQDMSYVSDASRQLQKIFVKKQFKLNRDEYYKFWAYSCIKPLVVLPSTIPFVEFQEVQTNVGNILFTFKREVKEDFLFEIPEIYFTT